MSSFGAFIILTMTLILPVVMVFLDQLRYDSEEKRLLTISVIVILTMSLSNTIVQLIEFFSLL